MAVIPHGLGLTRKRLKGIMKTNNATLLMKAASVENHFGSLVVDKT